MKSIVPTLYGNLRVSARRSPFVDDVVVSVAGPVRNADGDPVPFDSYYRFDQSAGWIRVGPGGNARDVPVQSINAFRHEIEGLVDRWLRDHHEQVKAVIVHSLQLNIEREQRDLHRALELARAKVAERQEFLRTVRDRL